MRCFSKRDLGAALLLIFGLSQMAGDLIGNRVLKGIGAASVIAPCPKVFCDVNGLEGFASRFTLESEDAAGMTRTVAITPELYAQLKGPYNRRNAYGAVISFGPKLPTALWQSVYDFGWQANGPLRRELGLPNEGARVSTIIRTQTRGRHDVWRLQSSATQ
jgi:hypothetical protein